MQSLYYSYNLKVDRAYIIRVKESEKSQELASRCARSCDQVGMPYEFWDAYDGIQNPIVPPDHLKDHVLMNMIKIFDHYMVRGEVACALSHISLWSKCVEQDRPLVILEHDAIMVKPYLEHNLYNSICYLGSQEQVKYNHPITPTPPHGSEGNNHHFICRAHAYAIDPAVARSMLVHVLKYGITHPLDLLIRADIFPMHQMGIFAYDDIGLNLSTIQNRPKEDLTNIRDDSAFSTIRNRPKEGRTNIRNDDLRR